MKIISFEGFEYSGKSTQIKLLQNYFKKNKIKSFFTREPGGNKRLEKIRKIILQSNFDNLSLILFFFASRFSLLSSMKKSNLVVFDRFFDSTYAYQKITKAESKQIKKILSMKKKNRSNLNDLKEIIDRVGGFSYAQQKISEFNNQAIEALSPYPDTPYKKSMIDLISFNAQRKG